MVSTPPSTLLLLEDDTDLGQALADHLRSAGHAVTWCQCIAQALLAPAPAMALVDLQLPDGDGLDLLRRWRSAGQGWPVIVLTARDQVSDRIRLLQAGADDYLVKPFDLDELLARVDAVSRRSAGQAEGRQGDQPSRWRIDLDARQAWRGTQRLDLTQMEWAVLACLAQRRGRIYSRSDIEDRLDATGLAEATSNSLEVIVSRLRKKLGADAITTHRGLGYRLEP
jgi:two-component system OmpR family response regulator